MRFEYQEAKDLIRSVDQQTNVLQLLENAANMDSAAFDTHCLRLVHSLAEYVLACPLRKDVYHGPTGALRFGLFSGLFAFRVADQKIFTTGVGTEIRRQLDPQYRFAAFAACLGAIPALIHSNLEVRDATTDRVWHGFRHNAPLAQWLKESGAKSPYEIAWRKAPATTSPATVAVLATDVFGQGFWNTFDPGVTRAMYDALMPGDMRPGETPLTTTVREAQRLAREYELRAATRPYVGTEPPAGVSAESLAQAIADTAPTKANSDEAPPLADTGANSGGDPDPSPEPEKELSLYETLPAVLQQFFTAIRADDEYERLMQNIKATEAGIVVPIAALGRYGLSPTSVVEQLSTVGLVAAKEGRRIVLKHEAKALLERDQK
ncbi:TraI domain-containing protein [Pandoraea sp. NPDC090278]|uniref:TraI domain-containing protein n=1 Tax=Pandoraea sp. NPDC090278 TaxID=3364391 RepID=UPI003839FFAD